MTFHLYAMTFPMEALVASNLAPEAFGTYMAIGTRRMTRGKVVFVEVDPAAVSGPFDLERARRECRPGPDGAPKPSVYLSIYRVLEHLPLEALKSLHVVTKDGRSLRLEPQRLGAASPHARRAGVYLYQELCPVRPLVVSVLDPLDFGQWMTDPANPVRVPKLLFARMKLGADPSAIAAEASLPYGNLPHLQNCALEVLETGKSSKTVERIEDEFFYSAVMDGFYLAEPGAALYFPFPTDNELKDRYYLWWRSAV